MDARIAVLQADITTLAVDAIVNAANQRLLLGGGVCGAIHRAAGPELAQACAAVGPCPTGQARITPGFRLPARYVIHAVGPVWRDGTQGEDSFLASCYQACLDLAREHRLVTLAIPAISTGIYGFPPERAARIAVEALRRGLVQQAYPTQVLLVAYDAASLHILAQATEHPAQEVP